MLFTDLLPALLGQHPTGVPMPLGGPMLPPIAKSPSNATVTPTLAAHNVPPALDPASLMNAITNSQLKNLESQRLEWQIQQMKDVNANDFPAIGALYGLGGGGMGVGTTMPGTNGAFGGELPPAPSRTGAAAGWGPLADPAVSAMKGAGASDAFIQAAMGHGLAEGGFQQPWAKAGGGENSYGHWQFNQAGELPGFEKFAAVTGPSLGIENPTDTRLQAMYLMQRAEQLHPGITKTDDANQAMDVLGTKFERYKGNAPGQRRDYLAAAQRALAVPAVPTADMGGAGTRYGAAFGGSTTPLSDTMATAINPIPIPKAPQMAAAPQMAGGGTPAPAGPRDPLDLRPYFPAEEPPPSQAVASNGGAATPTTVTPLGGSAQPVVPTQAPPAFGSLAPGGMPSVPQPGANPQMVAATNLLRKAMALSSAGLPVGNLMMQAVQNSPAFQAEVARQKGWATLAPQLAEKWQAPMGVRGGVINPATGGIVGALPLPPQAVWNPDLVDPTTGQKGTYEYKSFNPGTGQFGPSLGAAKPGPGATAQATTAGTNVANLAPLLPGTQGPAPSSIPTVSPHGIIPPQSEEKLPESAIELKDAIPHWQQRVEDWTKAIEPARQAQQRLETIAEAFKMTQSGSFAVQKGQIAAALKSAGINLPESSFGSPKDLQLALHENILTTLPLLKAATPRPTQAEFMFTTENREHPNIQPEANLQMLGEDIALMKQAQNLPAAFNASRWHNPLSFESSYFQHNKLSPAVEQEKTNIGPLKGMEGGPGGVPQGSQYLGTHQGKPVYNVPDGKGGFARKVLQ